MLNREDLNNTDFQHVVMVTATDPWGITARGGTQSDFSQSVTITIDNVNEAPTMTGGATRSDHMEGDSDPNTAGVQPDITYTAIDPETEPSESGLVAARRRRGRLLHQQCRLAQLQEGPQLRESRRRRHGQQVHGHGGRYRREEADRNARRGHHRQEHG